MPVSLIQKLSEIPLAFFDTETTGISTAYGDRVIELGIVRLENGIVAREYAQLINPRRRIAPGVVALTGIHQHMVDNCPTFKEQLPAAMELLHGAILVGHNVRFDLSFLSGELRKCGVDIESAFPNTYVMDTLMLARKRFGRGGNGLQRLSRRLGIAPPIAHRALADAQTTHQVFEKLMEPLAGWNTVLADALIAQGGATRLKQKTSASVLPLELEEALEQKISVMLDYLDSDEQPTRRKIDPISIKRVKGELVLLAHCHLRAAQRTFKLERIVQLTRVQDLETASEL